MACVVCACFSYVVCGESFLEVGALYIFGRLSTFTAMPSGEGVSSKSLQRKERGWTMTIREDCVGTGNQDEAEPLVCFDRVPASSLLIGVQTTFGGNTP